MGLSCKRWASACAFFAFGVLCLPFISSAESALPASTANLYKMEFVGHIENPLTKQLVQDIYAKYFANPFAANPDRNMAERLEIYIAPDVVENNSFVPPGELEFSPEYIATFEGIFLPEEGCHIQRRFYVDGEDFLVMVVESADVPILADIETCVLSATLAALGEDLDGQPIMPNSEMRNLIEEIVNGG